jgi:hypothetical protein
VPPRLAKRLGSECLSHTDIRAGEPIGFIGLERSATADFEELAADRAQLLLINAGLVLALAGAISGLPFDSEPD